MSVPTKTALRKAASALLEMTGQMIAKLEEADSFSCAELESLSSAFANALTVLHAVEESKKRSSVKKAAPKASESQEDAVTAGEILLPPVMERGSDG